ncbi:F0F1 ATP synthase subunit B [Candidatus Peregrinibacteria bacterium]|nr:F0F1 ATP synthase subunit B [Candidatus Peregrinibacteria bacterium]
MEALHKLGIDFKVLIAQIINFGILFLILRHFLYRPILGALESRKKRIRESLEKAAEIEKKSVAAEEEYKNRILKANKEADEIIESARLAGEKTRKGILAKAEEEANSLREAAERGIAEERRSLYADLKRNSGKLAIFILTKILKQDLGEEFLAKSVDKALKEIEA